MMPVADPGFPKGGGNSRGGCDNLLFRKIFCRKLHENERIWTERVTTRPLAPPPPLDPPMGANLLLKNRWKVQQIFHVFKAGKQYLLSFHRVLRYYVYLHKLVFPNIDG